MKKLFIIVGLNQTTMQDANYLSSQVLKEQSEPFTPEQIEQVKDENSDFEYYEIKTVYKV